MDRAFTVPCCLFDSPTKCYKEQGFISFPTLQHNGEVANSDSEKAAMLDPEKAAMIMIGDVVSHTVEQD